MKVTYHSDISEVVEQINDMMVRMKNMEKEKQEILRQYQLLEEELETRRREIFILKREDSAQYMLAERENWKALLTQQKQMNAKLEKGYFELPFWGLDLEISRERISSLQQQLDDFKQQQQNPLEEKDGDDKDSVKDSHQQEQDEHLQKEELASNNVISMGPPQPVTPPGVVEELSDAYTTALADQSKLKEELTRLREEVDTAKKEAEEAKRVNM